MPISSAVVPTQMASRAGLLVTLREKSSLEGNKIALINSLTCKVDVILFLVVQ